MAGGVQSNRTGVIAMPRLRQALAALKSVTSFSRLRNSAFSCSCCHRRGSVNRDARNCFPSPVFITAGGESPSGGPSAGAPSPACWPSPPSSPAAGPVKQGLDASEGTEARLSSWQSSGADMKLRILTSVASTPRYAATCSSTCSMTMTACRKPGPRMMVWGGRLRRASLRCTSSSGMSYAWQAPCLSSRPSWEARSSTAPADKMP
mmetsp:Transcript_14996/g.45274  ORF Transcript_14996/g.45274 Transcript_14996/m.45274 type:complete len:206 (+) Transcript_14996:33-650(+)